MDSLRTDSTLDVASRCPIIDWEAVADHDALTVPLSNPFGD